MRLFNAFRALLIIGLGLLIPAAWAQNQSPGPVEILKQVSEILYPPIFVGKVELLNVRPNEDDVVRQMFVQRKGTDKVLLEVLSQGEEQGQKILRTADEILLLFPDICQVISLDPSQPLFGTLFNVGDIARLDLAADYQPEITGTEPVGQEQAYILDLKAKVEDATYARIKMWVRVSDLIPLKSEYYGDSGRLIGRASYEEPLELAGKIRPSKITTTSELEAGATVLTIKEMSVPDELPDEIFTEEALLKSCKKES